MHHPKAKDYDLASLKEIVCGGAPLSVELAHTVHSIDRGDHAADLQARAASLTPKQLIALRFAGNDELPALTRDVLDGKLQSQKAIKLAITHWQADWFRV